MKYRKILLILAIATFSLTACKKEQNPAPAETTAIEETAVEKETTEIEDAETKEAENIDTTETKKAENIDTTEIEAETTSENISVETADTTETQGALDPSNITVNPDGTYSFTDDFLVAVQGINGASALTDANLNDALQEAAAAIKNIGLTDERYIVDIIETVIGIRKYDQQKQQNQQQQATTSGQDQVAPGPVDEVGAMDDVIAGLLQEGPGDMTLGEGDGTHVGTNHSEGAMDWIFQEKLQEEMEHTHGEGDGTHVGVGH